MAERRCLPWYRGCFLILLGTLIACRTTSDLTLEEAKKISTTGERALVAPPRAGITDLINPRYLEGLDDEFCRDEPPEPVDIDRVIENIEHECKKWGYSSGAQYCLPDRLFSRGRKAMNRGRENIPTGRCHSRTICPAVGTCQQHAGCRRRPAPGRPGKA